MSAYAPPVAVRDTNRSSHAGRAARGGRTGRKFVAAFFIPLMVATPARAQSPLAVADGGSLLDRPARLAVRDLPLALALHRLAEASGVVIAFSPSLVSAGGARVDCDCTDASVGVALERILESTPFHFREMLNEVLVYEDLRGRHNGDLHLEGRLRPEVRQTSMMLAPGPPLTARLRQDTAVAGIIVSSAGQPLSGAQISVEGTPLGALSDEQGRFRVGGLSGTEVTLRVVMLGYRLLRQTVATGATDLRLVLEETAIGLEQIVVTATGAQRMREVGSAIASVAVDSVMRTAPAGNLAELLSGRASGVVVSTFSGTSVGRSRIRIRGSSSPSLLNEPIVYVDGVRVDTDPEALSFATNGQVPSRFNDINPEEIESIDVIKGPSASTLYGTQAANGVILITTKSGRGLGDRAAWRFWAEAGRITEPNEYPPNFQAVSAEGAPCPLTSVVAGQCTQTELRTFNLLEDPSTTPFQSGSRAVIGGSVGGGTSNVNYFISGEFESEDGVFTNDGFDKVNLRGNFSITPAQAVTVAVNSGYVSSNVEFFAEGGTALGPITNGLAGRADPDGWFQLTPQQIAQIDSDQDVERFIGSTTIQVQPFGGLTVRGVAGLDAITREDERFFPVGVFPGARAEGVRETGRNQTLKYTSELLARLEKPITTSVSSRTSAGAQFFRDFSTLLFAEGQQLVPGSNSIATAAQTTTREETVESRSVGVFADQQFGFHDRLFLSAGVRADDNSSFGREFDLIVYPKLSGSWVISEEPFFPSGDVLNSLRMRAAWGQSGNQPGAVDALQFFNAYPSTTPDGESGTGVSFENGSLGNPNLKPERSSEIELGFDAALLEDRIALSLTYYDKRTSDALVFREVAPSVGASAGRWENLARTRNYGIEAGVSVGILDRPALQFSIEASGSYNENELVELGEGVAPISVGGQQRHAEGYALGGYWLPTVTGFSDENGDGLIAPSEISVTDTAVYLGEVIPPFSASIQPSLRLFDRIRVSGMLDLRYGHKLYNFTEGFRCNLAGARGRNDPDTPLEEQARCVAHALRGVAGGFVHDAGFAKLRELSVTVLLPDSWLGAAGMTSASLTVAGRNLATWTDYPWIDPDVNSRGINFTTLDFFQPAPTRHWILRLNVGF